MNDEHHHGEAAGLGDGAEDWDDRYSQVEQRWSGRANATLVEETAELSPGRALDVGCGEGADAIWLALRGWEVQAVDISQVALDRARTAAASADVEIDWVQADIAADPPEQHGFDLVTVHYPALRHTPDDHAIRTLIDAVAAGGTLLVVHHSLEAGDQAERHGFDPTDYIQPADVADRLDEAWTVEVHEIRPRRVSPGPDAPDVPDIVLKATRTG